jgi:leucyl-tRNA synthetase
MSTQINEINEEDGRYPFRDIEKKWQARWSDADVYKTLEDSTRPKHYVLTMFPYPSGSGLHVGHGKNYIPGDVYARFKKMQGFNVLHPMGWDAFGQPAEQDAIRRNVNPKVVVPELAAEYKRQMKVLGLSYDWSREINSTDPSYYKWNQWIFLKLLEHGLAFRDFSPVNWCPSCNTVLANDETADGKCWRCSSIVEKKPMLQWKVRITAYAEKLIAGLDTIAWPEGIKTRQREWIGRSDGAEVTFATERGGLSVFTTRPDTLWGATFMVLSPEHPLIEELTTDAQREAVAAYKIRAAQTSEIERTAEGREKTGVFTGAYATNPVTNTQIPLWIADYVLMGYGTGAIMAVPAHDQRDFEFARKFGLEVLVVVQPEGEVLDEKTMEKAWAGDGVMAGSGPLNGVPAGKTDGQSVKVAIAHLEKNSIGKGMINYKLRDWLLSRQRYWGTPIPIVHCKTCGIVPVPEDQLPIILPDVENYKPSPDGRSPLASIPDFVNCSCPQCGAPAERETDTMAGAVDSSWYFLRYASPNEANAPWNMDAAKYWMPVDMYLGGAEHAVGHLLYCRFFTQFLFDIGYSPVAEPAHMLRNQGMLNSLTPVDASTKDRKPIKPDDLVGFDRDAWIARWEAEKNFPAERVLTDPNTKETRNEPVAIEFQWLKMSKSKGNAATPDDMANKYGTDAFRLYILFEAPYEDSIQWSEERMSGTFRFLGKVWDTMGQILIAPPSLAGGGTPEAGGRSNTGIASDESVRELQRKTHQTIAKVTDDIANLRFNTSVAALMVLADAIRKFVMAGNATHPAARESAEALVKLLAPMAPHIADELWERLGNQNAMLYNSDWPASDPALAADDEILIVVQVNGKLRDKLTVPAGISQAEMETLAQSSEAVVRDLEGKTIRKVITIPGRLVNIVAN